MPTPILIAGLGNPGKEYENTYHNVGALFIDHISDILGTRLNEPLEWKSRKGFRYARVRPLLKKGAILLVPDTFMNTSGPAIASAARFFSIPPEEVVLVHDEIDLLLGEFKIQAGRGAAGHHGVESVVAALGTKDFLRARIGIRPGRTKDTKAGGRVLKRIVKTDQAIFEDVFQTLARMLMEKV